MILPRRSVRLREIHHLTQREAARKLGIAASTLNKIERGLCSDITWKILGAFCRAFDTNPDYLLGFDRFYPAQGSCLRCAGTLKGEPHSLRECIMSMHDQGRPVGWIAKEFDFTLKSVECIVREEYRIRRERRSHEA